MDLTTVIAMKQFLGITSSNQDALFASLIARESRAIERFTSRTFPFVERTRKRLDGTGTSMLMLPDSPLIEVSELSISGVDVQPATGTRPGFVHDDTTVYLAGGAKFPYARQVVTASWRAGYQAEETVEVPAPTGNEPTVDITIVSPGSPAVVNSITDDTGVIFAETANAPAPGEFRFTRPAITFNASDAGKTVIVDMYYVPGDIEQACIEMIAVDIKQRDTIGIRSKTLAQETVVYDNNSMPPSAKQLLEPYRRMAAV